MEPQQLRAISPADGRYADKIEGLRELFSEYGLIRFRVLVEIRWLQFLADQPEIAELEPLPALVKDLLNGIVDNFSIDDALKIKQIESITNHDVKACEYFLKDRLQNTPDFEKTGEFIHFGCTSEDINNLAYALMLRHGRSDVVIPAMHDFQLTLGRLAERFADLPMLAHTHGQTASPTTVGKELANVSHRLQRAQATLASVEILGKFNGAVGNYNAHAVAYPDADWHLLSKRFVESLGLTHNPMTTQIEPHDWIAEYCHCLSRYNTVLIDFCRDVWGYISLGYFTQKAVDGEVGSSTMPHKINPIDFENAEGNFGVANALLGHFADKLPVSRWQRDLTDSTVLRNLGVAMAHFQIAMKSLGRGLNKISPDTDRLNADLAASWEVLGEAVQTVMRRYGIANPYEKLKTLTRGTVVTPELMRSFIMSLDIPDSDKQRLCELTPATYTGFAADLVKHRNPQ